MQPNKYNIFISYRRLDSEGRTSGRDIARTIKLKLETRGYTVFFDYSEIKDDEFEKVIIPAIQKSSIFILVLSKDALLRCANEGDWVRREIEMALKSGCKIIPINPSEAFEGWPENLPETLTPITKIQISEISMGSLFDKSIDVLEERFGGVVKSKKTSHQLRSLTFFTLYLILGGICCYHCAESLHLLFKLPRLPLWVIIICFFIFLSLGIRFITSTFNPKNNISHRTRTYLTGLALFGLYGLLLIVPCQTHALYYNFTINEELQTDLKTTKEYLTYIQKRETDNAIEEEIANIKHLMRELSYGQFNTKDIIDIQKADSVIQLGYDIIRSCPDIEYETIDDEIRYTTEGRKTRVRDLMDLTTVWEKQLSMGPSKDFLLALLISFILIILSAFSFLKAMDI